MSSAPFVSFASNREDVVLHRALGDVGNGRYVTSSSDSVAAWRAFDERGWQRVSWDGAAADSHVASQGAVHFAVLGVDVLDRAAAVLSGANDVRPWVLVIRGVRSAALPSADVPGAHGPRAERSWATPLLDIGYRRCLFDGFSVFFVERDRAAELGPLMSYPACAADDFLPVAEVRLRSRCDELAAELEHARIAEARALDSALRWRSKAVDGWAESVAGVDSGSNISSLRQHNALLVNELENIRRTTSWRVTAPLRRLRRLTPGRSAP